MAGDFGSFDPSTYHFIDADLQQIINQTQSAITEMGTLNTKVQSNTDALGTANRSDSGQILTSHLTTWMSDFHTCVNKLTELNQKATALLAVNRRTDADATSGAR